MAKQVLNAGSANNDKTGDTLRAGALKIKANFEEIYAALANDGMNISGGNVLKTGDYQDLRNKPEFAVVATSGDFYDLSARPDIGIFVGVPGNSTGSEGHVAGNLAFDGNNLYVCREDYVETEEFGSFNFLRADGDVAYSLVARFANTGSEIAFTQNESLAPIAPEVDWTVSDGTTTRTITAVSEELDGSTVYYLCTLDGAFTSTVGTHYTLSFPLASGQYAFYSTWNAAYQNLIDAHAIGKPIHLHVTYDGYGRLVNHVARNSITNEIVITYTAGSEIADYEGLTIKIDQPSIWKSIPWAPYGSGFSGIDLGSFKISGNILGTEGSTEETWGASGIGIDPGGESNAGIWIPRVADQTSGANLDIYNNGTGGGSIRLMTDNGTWQFKNDGDLTFPDGTIQSTAYTGDITIPSKFVAVNNSGVISGSDDGITWNEYNSSLDGVNRVAVGPNNIVYIADSFEGPAESLWYAATYDTAPTEVTSLTSRDFAEVKYFKSISKFIAVGNDGDGSPALYYSDDGITWTTSTIDPTYLATFEDIGSNSFCDIAENELGFLVIATNKTLGGFFLTDITDTMNGDNHVDLSNLPGDPDEVVWANSFYFAGWHLITDNDEWAYNSASDPTTSTFSLDWITLDSTWESEIGIPGGGLVEWVAGEYGGMTVVMASTNAGQIVYWPTVPAGPYVSVPKPFTATITGWTSSAASAITYTEVTTPGSIGEKFTVTDSTVTGYNGTYYLGADGGVFTNNDLTTAFDTTGLDPFTGTATISWSHGQFIDALHYSDGAFYAGNDNEELFKSSNGGQTWVKVDQLGGGLGEGDGYLNDIDSYVDTTSEITFNGVQIRGKASEGKYGLIKLVPNTSIEGHSFLDNGQFVEIYPTLSFDAPHIHIAAGVGAGSEGDIFLGDDSKHVEVNHAGQVNIRSYYSPTFNQYNWSFNTDGSTNFPWIQTDLHNGGLQYAQTLKFGVAGQQVVITGPTPETNYNAERIIIQGQRAFGTGEGGDVYLWAGDAEGINGGDIKIYAGDADNTEAGYGGYINLDGGQGFNQGGSISITGGYSNGGTGGNVIITGGGGVATGTVQISVNGRTTIFGSNGNLTIPGGIVAGVANPPASGDPVYPGAIDLTNTINKLGDNEGSWYTLADGYEGQIMYLVPKDGTTNANTFVRVANARILNASGATTATVYTDVAFNPFSADSGTVPNVVTMIFTDGAWQSNAGIWD